MINARARYQDTVNIWAWEIVAVSVWALVATVSDVDLKGS
jgi:hypothetical protein